MSLGSASIDGLYSGLDTQSIIDSLATVQKRPMVLLQQRKTDRAGALTVYQSLTGQVLALQASANSVADGKAFQARSATVSDQSALLATAGTGAAVGTYQVQVERLAQASKLASRNDLASATADLGFTGDILVNGHTISLKAGDSLNILRDSINQAGIGVSASILNISPTQNRLVLTSLQTGAAHAITLADANDSGFLQGLGLLGNTASLGHALTNGAASDSFSAATTPLSKVLELSAPPQGSVQINGAAVDMNLGTDSLQDLATRITATVSGVQAQVTSQTANGKTTYRLEITSDSGTPTFTDDGGVLQALGLQTLAPKYELSKAQDARVYIDGQAIERSSNSIDDAVEGLSLDLLKADLSQTLTVDVEPNTQSAADALQKLVSSYNAVVDSINQGLTFDSDTKTGGAFFGDYSIVNIQSGLLDQTLNSAGITTSGLNMMSQIGLSTDANGKLQLDNSKLMEAMETDPQGVLGLLTTRGEASDAGVAYVESTAYTQDSGFTGFAVNITQAATRATAQSAVLADGIAQSETLTINDSYNVTLQAGDSLQTAADRLNAIFSGNGLGLTATITDNRLQIQSNNYGSFYTLRIASSLADGAGGTNLGAAAAGTAQVYNGLDVQGTVGGTQYQAQGFGQWLTATTGPAKGLKISVSDTATGDHGVVKVSKGLVSRLAGYTTQITDTDDGALTRATTSLSDSIQSIQDEMDKMQKSVDAYIENLQLRFATSEAVIARNKSTLQLLTTKTAQGTTVNASA
jgi:flagellar hook-associated protein 2